MMQRLLAPLMAGLLLVTSGCALLPRETEDPPPVLEPPVKSEKAVYTVRKGDIAEEIQLRALVVPARTAELYWPDGGRVAAVHVRAGDKVTAGQLLAEIHTGDVAQQIAQAEIRLEKARLSLEAAQYNAQFSRTAAADFQIRGLELDTESARLDLERLRAKLADARLVAPFAGEIQAVAVKPGDLAQAFAAVITVADPTELIIQADVDSGSLQRLAAGQKARLEFSELPGAGTGRVIELPDPRTTTVLRVKVRPDSALTGARAGMAGKVWVVLQEKKGVLLLANAALRQFNGRNYVLLQEPRREVDLVPGIAGETETEIERGLKEGDRVIGR